MPQTQQEIPVSREDVTQTETPSLPRPRFDKPRVRSARDEYRVFGNMESRNGLQEWVEIPLLLRALKLPPGGRVLEVGCGRGIALPLLSERLAPAELVGVDIDGSLIAAAQLRVDCANVRAALHVADVRELPFDTGSFDLVIDFGTCYHVSDGRQGQLSALREISRVLRVGGLFVHETRVAQHLAHPIRSMGRRLPWPAVPKLTTDRSALLWTARRRVE